MIGAGPTEGGGRVVGCPDGGRCHHGCMAGCFRVQCCGPLSGVYPDDRWPEQVARTDGAQIALAAADAVAVRDPAPRAEPDAWGLIRRGEEYVHRAVVTRRQVDEVDPRGNSTVVPLYRDPRPAPAVPCEMDRANLDLAAALSPDADRHTHAAYLEKTRRRHRAGWRLVPPTGGAS